MGRLATAFPRKGKLEVTKVDMPDYKVLHYPSKSTVTLWALGLILIVLGSLLAWRIMEDQTDCIYLAVPCPDCSEADDESSVVSTNKVDLNGDGYPSDRVVLTTSSNSEEVEQKAEDGSTSNPPDDPTLITADGLTSNTADDPTLITPDDPTSNPPDDPTSITADDPTSITADASTSSTSDGITSNTSADIINFLADIIKNLTISINFNEPPAGAPDTNSSDAGADINLPKTDQSLVKLDESTVPLLSFFMPPILNLFSFLESGIIATTEVVPMSSTQATDSASISTEATEAVATSSTEAANSLLILTEGLQALAGSTEATENYVSSSEATGTFVSSTEATGTVASSTLVTRTVVSSMETTTNFPSIPTQETTTGKPDEATISWIPVKSANENPKDPATIVDSHAQLNSTSESAEDLIEAEPLENNGKVLDVDPKLFNLGQLTDASAQMTSSSEEYTSAEANVTILADNNGTTLVRVEPLPFITLQNETTMSGNFAPNNATSQESGEDDGKSPGDYFPAWFFNPFGLLQRGAAGMPA